MVEALFRKGKRQLREARIPACDVAGEEGALRGQQAQRLGVVAFRQALVTGLAVACGIVVAIGCSIAILRCAAGGNRQTLTVLAAVGFVGALAGGLAVRMLMWLFSEGFMELFEAARVVLNC